MDVSTHGSAQNINDSIRMQCKLPGHKNCRMWVSIAKGRPIHTIYKECCRWMMEGFMFNENQVTHEAKKQLTEQRLGMVKKKMAKTK